MIKEIDMFKPVPQEFLDPSYRLSKSDLVVLKASLVSACKTLELSFHSKESIEFFSDYADKCTAKIIQLKRLMYELN